MAGDPLDWHRRALAGEKPPIHTEPECGWFLYKRVTLGLPQATDMIPGRIYWASPEVDPETGEVLADQELFCDVGGVLCDPLEMWLWLSKRPISHEEYLQRMGELF